MQVMWQAALGYQPGNTRDTIKARWRALMKSSAGLPNKGGSSDSAMRAMQMKKELEAFFDSPQQAPQHVPQVPSQQTRQAAPFGRQQSFRRQQSGTPMDWTPFRGPKPRVHAVYGGLRPVFGGIPGAAAANLRSSSPYGVQSRPHRGHLRRRPL